MYVILKLIKMLCDNFTNTCTHMSTAFVKILRKLKKSYKNVKMFLNQKLFI